MALVLGGPLTPLILKLKSVSEAILELRYPAKETVSLSRVVP